MYNKPNNFFKSEKLSLENYINNGDLYNSKVLYILPMLPEYGSYTVDLDEKRIDLIAEAIYSDVNMAQILLLYNGLTVDQLVRGKSLRVPKYIDVLKLLENITQITTPREFLKDL